MTDPAAVVEHPQPVGAFALPAGFLLVPGDGADIAAARDALVAGRLPPTWPPALRGVELTHRGASAQAIAAFDADDPVGRYNRWVLDPESADLDTVRAGLPDTLAPLVDVVAYTIGLAAQPPRRSDGLPAEVAALVLAARATAALERGDRAGATDLLTQGSTLAAASAPALAAVLRGNAGTVAHDEGDVETARADLTAAVEALAGTDLRETRAELLHVLGSIDHEAAASGRGDARALFRSAMGHYYEALSLVSEESAPQLWGWLNLNLATAYLASPMTTASDQLRLGVAIQALRACRRVFGPEEHPEPWSTATLNLANALVYTPSTHQGDNLVEAVELYEEVLVAGVREADPLGRARLLSNQANALAHLGMFDQARPKLVEARYVFEEHLDHDAVMTVRGILDEIAKAGVTDPDEELVELARQAEQMARMPRPAGAFTSGIGVSVTSVEVAAGDLTGPPPKPRVTVLQPGQTHPDVGP
jgi:tetratricopeptide (TPR) repeat protein